MRTTRIINLMFRRQRSKSEKTAARADKRKQQPAALPGRFAPCGEDKPKRHQRVKENRGEISREAARVGKPSAPRQLRPDHQAACSTKWRLVPPDTSPPPEKAVPARRWQIH